MVLEAMRASSGDALYLRHSLTAAPKLGLLGRIALLTMRGSHIAH
jgi:hypothetical protein